LFQLLFNTDIAAMTGALLGGVGGFLLAKGLSPALSRRENWQPVILSVGLPPDELRVETSSQDNLL